MTTTLLLLASAIAPVLATLARSPTPPMGWNSYNAYSCSPHEDIVKLNAQGLIDLGLKDLGYDIVTTDCGWPTSERDSQQRMQWNATLFPSGGKALGDFIHSLGLKFGLYSGAGYYQCGSTNLTASLGYEDEDAEAFAEWGGDTLKYDNCYATSRTTMVDSTSTEAQSPARFEKMAASLNATDRDMQYFICQWGIGQDVGDWASKTGNTWRMSNDIYNAWRSIWRITNEVFPYYRWTQPGAFPDMDMLIIGLDALSEEEERFHFGMWAINKSPLIIGGILNGSFQNASLATLSNQEVISIDQDALGKQAQLMRRYTEEEWDIWLGELSDSRRVLGIANWRNQSRRVEVDLSSLNISSANARDVWALEDLGAVSGSQDVCLVGHELKLWVLSNITTKEAYTSSRYYAAANGTLAGTASITTCAAGECAPVAKKVGDIGPGATVTISSVSSRSNGKNLVGVDFINYDYAFETAWDWGSNTRNMTIAVNGGTPKRWAFPISGGDWYETGRLMIDIDGFQAGDENQVVFRSMDASFAPDLVGFDMFE
ncbi:alpha-galactosidase precursor [Lophiotrema nucula]|uniref:Alpha-galactosidase n=1 Tax=Lophiotrema nucula TaxID=690887 RepID=A0A6A5ZJ82_9PLEO|nr:alpha-galactosidase precursor [Lophiotrema nucula]